MLSGVVFLGASQRATSWVFPAKRGIRQGDPLSPTLFILVEEYLLRGIKEAQQLVPSTRFFTGLDFLVPCLAFADDVIIFCNGSKKSVAVIKRFTSHFEDVSGQMINNSKSFFVTSCKATPSRVNVIRRSTGFQQGKLPIKYLGVPLSNGRKYNILFAVDKIRSKVQSLNSSTLSFGGRLILIQNTLATIPSYLMQSLRIPAAVIDRIEKILNQFLWQGGSDKGVK